jgi:hypothetical protein
MSRALFCLQKESRFFLIINSQEEVCYTILFIWCQLFFFVIFKNLLFFFLNLKKLKKYEMAMFVESFQLGCSRTYIVVFHDVEFKRKKKKKENFLFCYFGRILNLSTCQQHVCGIQHGTKTLLRQAFIFRKLRYAFDSPRF